MNKRRQIVLFVVVLGIFICSLTEFQKTKSQPLLCRYTTNHSFPTNATVTTTTTILETKNDDPKKPFLTPLDQQLEKPPINCSLHSVVFIVSGFLSLIFGLGLFYWVLYLLGRYSRVCRSRLNYLYV
jgi:hypothetical protein